MSEERPDPKNLVKVGGPAASTTATLRIGGDDLEPSEITHLLKCAPTKAHKKGDIEVGKTTGQSYVKRSGLWLLSSIDETSELDDQIVELLGMVSSDPDVWTYLQSLCSMNMFCGVFLNSFNEGFSLKPSTLIELGSRGIEFQVDIYGAEFDEELEGHFERARLRRSNPLN